MDLANRLFFLSTLRIVTQEKHDASKRSMNQLRHSFALRMIWFSTAVIAVAVCLSSIVAYQQSKNALETSLADELRALVSAVGPLIDGDLHELVRLDDSGEMRGRDEFEFIRSQLLRVRDSTGMAVSGMPVYTLRPAGDFERTRDLEFVVMTDPDESGEFLIGNRYPIQRHIREALEGRPAVSGLYRDGEGVWISAAAPIRDSLGNVVAVLQADRHVDYFYQQARSKAMPILLSAILSVCIGSVLSIVWTRALMRPIRRLVAANDRIGSGDLSTRVDLNRGDELGLLGDSLNRMAGQLETLQQREKMMASFAHLNPAPVMSFNSDGQILIANASSEELFDREELVGTDAGSLFAGLKDVDMKGLVKNGGMKNYTVRIGSRDFQFVIKGIPELDIAQMYGTDITDLKQAESEIQRARERAEVKAGQLAESVKELKLFNQFSVDRELRMVELKQQINELCLEADRPPAFDLESLNVEA